ncbi:MAG: DUF883 family protein [Bradyrhizobium sp.]
MSSTDAEALLREKVGEASYDRLKKDITAARNEIAALAAQISESVNGVAGSAKSRARQGYRQARDKVDSAVSDLSKRGGAAANAAQEAADTIESTVEDFVGQRPLAAIGLALGVGFLIGLSWRR